MSFLAWLNGSAKVTATMTRTDANGNYQSLTATKYVPANSAWVEQMMFQTWQQMAAALPPPAPVAQITQRKE